MVEFPGKGKTNSLCPPLLFGPRLISSKTRWKKKSSSSCKFPSTNTLAGPLVVLNICQGSPGPEAHAGFCRLQGQKIFWRSQQELAGSFTEAQKVPSKLWFYTTIFLSRNYLVHKFMHVDPWSQMGSCPNCFSLPRIYASVPGQQMSPGPAQSGWKHYPTGVVTRVQNTIPESRDADHMCQDAPALAQLFHYYHCS